MRTTLDPITRRDALAWLGGAGALAWAATSRGEERDRSPARIYLSMLGRDSQVRPEMAGVLALDPKDGSWSQVVPGPYVHARVTPDGRRALCQRYNPPAEQGLYVAELGGDGPPKRVAEGPTVRHFWSPDGRQIVYNERKPDRTFAVWRMNADGTGRARLPIPDTEVLLDGSPDGQWLLTTSSRPLEDGSRPEPDKRPIYLIHPDGTGERRLIEPGWLIAHPRFSPDSKTIVYARGADIKSVLTGPRHIETIGLDGKDHHVLLGPRGREQPSHAVWSPDGKELVVVYSEYAGKDDPPRFLDELVDRLAIVSPDGKALRRLDFPEELHYWVTDWR